MTSAALRASHAISAARARGRPARALAVLLVTAWAVLTVAVWQDLVEVPQRGLAYALLMLGVPLLAALVVSLPRRPVPRAVRVAAGGVWIVAGGLFGGMVAVFTPALVVVVVGVAVCSLLARRFPGGFTIALLFLSGTYGSMTAFTPLSPGILVDALLAGMWVGWIFSLLVGRREHTLVLTPGVIMAGLYFVATLVATLFAPNLNVAVGAFRAAAWHMAALFVVAYGGWSLRTHMRIRNAIPVIALLVGAYATLRWAIGPAEKEIALVAEHNVQYNQVAGEEKVQGSLPSGQQLGTWAAAAIPWCVAAALALRGSLRIVAAAAVPLLVIGLLGSQSRAGLAGAVVGTGLVLVLNQLARGFRGPRLGVAAVAVVTLAVCGGIAFPAVVGDNPAKIERYRNIVTPERDKAFQERLHKWTNAMAEVDDRPFGRGVGTASARYNYLRFQGNAANDVDNGYLEVAYEQGFAMMVFFIAMLLALLTGLARRAVWSRDRERAWPAMAAAGALAAFMIVLLTGQFFHALVAVVVWVMVGAGLAPFTVLRPGERRFGRTRPA